MKIQETVEEVAKRIILETYDEIFSKHPRGGKLSNETIIYILTVFFKLGSEWQQEQEQNNENSWFNEYQEVEDYIIKRIGDKFLEATPEKYNTASEATIALLENNWQQEQNKKLYSEEEVLRIITECKSYLSFGDEFDEIEWFEQFKKK